MPIGVSEEHRDLAATLRAWARDLGGPAVARAAEGDPGERFDAVWDKVVDQGVDAIGVPEDRGGAGGTALDAAVALEACAHELVPGALLGTAVVASVLARHGSALPAGARAGFAVDGGGRMVGYDAGAADHLLLPHGDAWWLVPADRASVAPAEGPDLTRRAAAVSWDGVGGAVVEGLGAAEVRRTALTFAAAECAGVASWCLATAVTYAKEREQFGQPIGRFQAVKHLCAAMLETSEAVAAAAWDAASAAGGDSGGAAAEQWAYAADVAGAVCLDGAVKVAQDCIQVLGGIGFTFEHDAHLYLRRVLALRAMLGGGDGYAAALAGRAVDGTRRRLQLSFDGRDEPIRAQVREQVAAIAALTAPSDRRAALVESGLLTPHWPAPYGRDAAPVEQLVIDEELAAAGVERPDLKIAGWAVPTILRHGTDAQREQFVRPSLLGEIAWCQLFSEPGAGSDLASLSTRAERVEDGPGGPGWRLTGQKVWTSLARQADWAICLARTGTDPAAKRHRGITYFLVDMRSEGLDVRPLREMTGDAMFNEVFLDGVFVPDEYVVGEVDGGWALARTTLANERVAMASTRLGASVERCVELVGRSESPSDLVQVGHQVALATVCALLGARVTLRTLAGAGPGAESSVAKLLGVRSRQQASELAVSLLGAGALLLGAGESDDVHEMLLTRCLSIAGGTTQVLRNVAAEQILGLPR